MKLNKILIVIFSLLTSFVSYAQMMELTPAQQPGQAEINKAMEYYEKHDMKQAIYWFEQAAQKGNKDAQTMVAGAYLDGMPGVEVNPQKAAYWCEKSANNGDPIGQLLYGYCFARGEGKPHDMQQAISWWKKSAAQNYVHAQWNLCICYTSGDGVSADATQAAIWARKAAENGHAQAQYQLAYYYAHGEGVARNYSLAVQWYQRSANQGYDWAYNNLAYLYADGQGVAKDFRKAHEMVDMAISISPNEPSFLDSKGELYLKEGNMNKATEIWNLLKSRFPEKVRQSVNDPNDIFCATMLKREKR
ncbi:MAG: sel1 repeat family protein [Bacteroidaceae bacterium]|nr:sel1 repeat family protein [Bacteroidaceae bacterium]